MEEWENRFQHWWIRAETGRGLTSSVQLRPVHKLWYDVTNIQFTAWTPSGVLNMVSSVWWPLNWKSLSHPHIMTRKDSSRDQNPTAVLAHGLVSYVQSEVSHRDFNPYKTLSLLATRLQENRDKSLCVYVCLCVCVCVVFCLSFFLFHLHTCLCHRAAALPSVLSWESGAECFVTWLPAKPTFPASAPLRDHFMPKWAQLKLYAYEHRAPLVQFVAGSKGVCRITTNLCC